MLQDKKVIFSGAQPSGQLTLGNYLGAIKNWAVLQYDYRCIYCVVDLHSLTVRQDPNEFRKNCLELMALYIACGLDPNLNLLFFQSHVSTHAELNWILNCFTYMGELNRMTQFKEKSQEHPDNLNAGLYTYPVLMAADILLYQTDLVPVGYDQKQHLELCRDIALRFNHIYGETFTVPEAYIPKAGARIMSLQNPCRKMSKSDDDSNAYITLMDTPDVIKRKIKRSVTDSENLIQYRDDKPGIQNLMTIYSCITDKCIADIEEEFIGKGYGSFKGAVSDVIIETLRPIQEKQRDILKDKQYIMGIIKDSSEKAYDISARTLSKVKRKVGLAPRDF